MDGNMITFKKDSLYILNDHICYSYPLSWIHGGIETVWMESDPERKIFLYIKKTKRISKNFIEVYFNEYYENVLDESWSESQKSNKIIFYDDKKITIPKQVRTHYAPRGDKYTTLYKLKDINKIFFLAGEDSIKIWKKFATNRCHFRDENEKITNELRDSVFVDKLVQDDGIRYEKTLKQILN